MFSSHWGKRNQCFFFNVLEQIPPFVSVPLHSSMFFSVSYLDITLKWSLNHNNVTCRFAFDLFEFCVWRKSGQICQCQDSFMLFFHSFWIYQIIWRLAWSVGRLDCTDPWPHTACIASVLVALTRRFAFNNSRLLKNTRCFSIVSTHTHGRFVILHGTRTRRGKSARLSLYSSSISRCP